MSCPTCSATMHCLGTLEGRTHFHCPVCGTRRMRTGDHTHDTVPALVGRCRVFEAEVVGPDNGDEIAVEWNRLGIAEAINVPGDRPS